ncbi:MAG: Glu/Leu/Phe/Val dehydrogenase dimerization domain-containing protein [Planctomycetota bacterium]|nr:Glu/Leu/Phe/Val dehydrogenase dimerization domain-containing protein [Planctomycetota bacterium]
MKLLQEMTVMGHERVAFHQDPESGLRAIIAIHDTTLGDALGGTRRWCYASESEAIFDVLRLSEGMTYKAAAADLAMGGAKSVILLDTPGQEATEAQGRAMGRFVETMKGNYIAAEDVGVNEQFCDWMGHETQYVMGGINVSRGGDPSPFTSLGAFNSMKACLAHAGRPVDFAGLTVGIQGLGMTGFKLAKLIVENGGMVIGTDVNPNSIQRAVDELDIKVIGDDEDLFSKELDILAPCALGGVLGPEQIESLGAAIVCGTSNNVLVDPDRDGQLMKDRDVIYAPDFIANAGGLIRLAGLYLGLSEGEIDQKVDRIEQTTLEVLKDTRNYASAYEAGVSYARKRIEAGRRATASS